MCPLTKMSALSVSNVWKSCCVYAPAGLCPHCGWKGRGHCEEGPPQWRTWHCGKGWAQFIESIWTPQQNANNLSQMDALNNMWIGDLRQVIAQEMIWTLSASSLHRPELMICRRWQTDWHSRAFARHCPNISPKSPSLERRWVHERLCLVCL